MLDDTTKIKESQTNSVQNAESPSSDRVLITTSALPKAWGDMLSWTRDYSVFDDFIQIVNCTGLVHHPHALGRVFVSLDSAVARSLLEKWRGESEYASPLYRLSAARTAHDPRLAAYRPLPNVVRATAHITEHISTYYLLALLLARLPAVENEDDRAWFERLRLWLFAHCLERAVLGNRQDKHLEVACSKLRLANDGSKDWLNLFGKLRTDSTGFENIGVHLAATARQMLDAHSTGDEFTHTQRQLLESLIHVARHEHAPKEGEDPFPANVEENRARSRNDIWDTFANSPANTEASAPEDSTLYALIPSADESDDLQIVAVDERASYVHQQLQANSVLLSAAEDLHFLPWSWNRPNPIELPLLATWLQTGLSAPTAAERAVASFSLVALMTGRSLRRALDIPLGSVPTSEWTLDRSGNRLLRIPPRRSPGWSPNGQIASSWVSPTADVSVQALPNQAARFLSDLEKGSSEPRCLGDLWNSAWGDSPESAFQKSVRDVLPRLSPAMLGNALAEHAFLRNGDGVFARLLSSHPRSGLPGATAYSSWGEHEVDATVSGFVEMLGFPVEHPKPVGKPLNALGSQLEVLEDLLTGAIRELDRRVEEIRLTGSFIDFHNALTAKLLIKLYAATGARPLRDPFCSPHHFGFQDGTVFIDDKHSRKARTGRLLALPISLIAEIQHSYLKHLSFVANALKEGSPELSAAMTDLSQARESDRLPFFFLLATGSGKISWRHASEKYLCDLELFDCPLPLNLFRHRLATRLRRHNVDSELIDALLGHAESGAATHGDRSFRVWLEDMEALRVPLELCLNALGFSPLGTWPAPPEALNLKWVPDANDGNFGTKARAKARRERVRTAISSAKGILNAHQKGRSLDELGGEELEALARALLTNVAGLPHPLGALRFSVLINAAKKLNRDGERKVRIRHRYRQLEEETSPFSNEGPGATAVLMQLQSGVETLVPHLTKLRLGKMDAAIVAVVLLIIQSRIADRTLIRDILSGQNVRLIRARPGFYLEHGTNLSPNDASAPVRRHRISNAAARLINMALERSQRRSFTNAPIPPFLRSIADRLISDGRLRERAEVSHLCASLTSLVDQANAQTLPGVVAGYLAGRIESVSLEWRDWLRLRWNRRIEVESAEPLYPQEVPDDDLPSRMPKANDIELLQKEAKKLFSTIRRQVDPELSSSALTPNARRDIKSAIRRTLAEADGTAPRACLLLGAWVGNLLERKSGHDGFLARNAIKRYFGALSPAFSEVGYAIDLELADEDEITEFYAEVIEGRGLENPEFVFSRLREFHRWLSEQVEVENPVWADLPYHDGSVPVDPGIVVESDYLRAFNFLARHASPKEQSRYAALLLLAAYRFGLRGGEVLGLLRSDWLVFGEYHVLVVQNNRYRRLKRKSSRRCVPLLTRLTPSEYALIDWMRAAAEARSGDDRHALLFPWANRNLQYKLKRMALAALKSSTGNPESNLHRLRHTAANQVMLGLTGIELPSWKLAGILGAENDRHIQELLLGRIGPTRRAPWASARYLGHAGLETAFQSYYHFISDLAEQCVALPEEPARQYEHAVDLTRLPVLSREKPMSTPHESSSIYGLAEMVIKSLRLLARGKREAEITGWLGWDPAEFGRLTAAVKEINQRMERQKSDGEDHLGTGFEWLRRIRNSGWNRMLRVAEKIDEKLSKNTSAPVSLSSVIRMVGSSRQLLAWREEQFRTLSLLRACWEIDEGQYAFLMTGKNTNMTRIALAHGFKPADPKRYGTRMGGHQIDAAYADDENILRVETRCALCLIENDIGTIRNRFELLVALISISGCDIVEDAKKH